MQDVKNTNHYTIIFGNHLECIQNRTFLNGTPIDILFDRYPYQKYPNTDPLHPNSCTFLEQLPPVCNPRSFIELCKDKWAFQKWMEQHGIYMPPVVETHFSEALQKWDGMAIAKPRFGSFGVGIEIVYEEPVPFRQSVQGMDPTLLQKYIRPPNGFAGIAVRQLLQRNKDRSWTFRTIVARTSKDDPIINAARGADICYASEILPKNCIENIQTQSKKIASIMGTWSPYIIEVGLDYVIDATFSPIFIEANAQPKGKLKALVQKEQNESIQQEYEEILQHPFEVLSAWV